jgi:hypothetical protein
LDSISRTDGGQETRGQPNLMFKTQEHPLPRDTILQGAVNVMDSSYGQKSDMATTTPLGARVRPSRKNTRVGAFRHQLWVLPFGHVKVKCRRKLHTPNWDDPPRCMHVGIVGSCGYTGANDEPPYWFGQVNKPKKSMVSCCHRRLDSLPGACHTMGRYM